LRKYEIVFILRPDLDEEKNATVIEKFKGMIEKQGGEILKLDKWGKRRLAYEVKDFREGLYVIIQMNAKSEIANEIDRVFKITDEVLRHIIVLVEQ